jgi:hypothetical protein
VFLPKSINRTIPAVTLFLSDGVKRAGEEEDDIACISRLAVVWFQDAFAMPIDEAVLEKIRGIN